IALSTRAHEYIWQLSPRRDIELAERPSEMRLDGLFGDEQRLGDLAVRTARSGEFCNTQLARRERVGSGLIGCPGPDPDRRQLGPGPAFQCLCATPRGQREALEQRLTRRGPLSSGAQVRPEVD